MKSLVLADKYLPLSYWKENISAHVYEIVIIEKSSIYSQWQKVASELHYSATEKYTFPDIAISAQNKNQSRFDKCTLDDKASHDFYFKLCFGIKKMYHKERLFSQRSLIVTLSSVEILRVQVSEYTTRIEEKLVLGLHVCRDLQAKDSKTQISTIKLFFNIPSV